MLSQVGKILIVFGVAAVLLGLGLLFADRVPFLGKLPGDLVFKGRNVTVYVPIISMLIISILLTILLNIFWRGR